MHYCYARVLVRLYHNSMSVVSCKMLHTIAYHSILVVGASLVAYNYIFSTVKVLVTVNHSISVDRCPVEYESCIAPH